MPYTLKPLLVLTLLLFLAGCVGRDTLTGESFRLSAPSLERALRDVRNEAVITEDGLRVGFLSDHEQLWFPVRALSAEEHENVTISLAELDTNGRVRRPYNGEPVLIIDEDSFSELLRDMLVWWTPLGPDEGLRLQLQRRELVSWRDQDGQIQLRPWARVPSGVTVTDEMDGRQLAAGMMRLLAEHWRHSGDDGVAHVLFRIEPGRPGGLAWIHADVENASLQYIVSPFAGDRIAEPALRVSLKTLNRVVVRSHLVTMVKNPFTTTRRFFGHVQDAVASVFRRGPKDINPDAPLYQGEGMDLVAWERRLDLITRSRGYPARLQFLVGGDQFFPDLINEIHRAEQYIDIRTYIFDNDEYARSLADLLRARSEEVEVRVMMDDLGSLMAGLTPPPGNYSLGYQPPRDMVNYLKKGVPARARRVGNPWLTGDHAKVTLIDRDIAYVGGMNYGEEYRYYWHDMMVRVEGPLVWRLQKEFHKAWAHAGPGGDFAYMLQSLRLPTLDLTDEYKEGQWADVRVLQTRSGRREILQAQLAAVRRAKSHIHIASPYFTEPSMINELLAARARGVDVRVVLPGEGNHNLMNSTNLFTANRLLEGGVRVFVYPGMTHIKAAVYDGWASFGSANFDRLSLKVNQEINLATSDPEVVRRLNHEVFEPHFAQSTELTEALSWNWQDYLASMLARPL